MRNFEEIYSKAEKVLDFLVSEHHFVVSDRKINNTNTQYVGGYTKFIDISSGDQFQRLVRLSTAPLRLEIDLEIGFQEYDKEEIYNIFELHNIEKCEEIQRRQNNLYDAINDPNKLYTEFEILADVLKQCGNRFFTNDKTLWDSLRKQRASIAQANQDTMMHLDAEKAFKEKNWQKVIDVLKNNEARLCDLDRKRLNYALNQLI